MSHGFCTAIRRLSYQIKSDKQHLLAAPLTPRQKKLLAQRIKEARDELKKVRSEYREYQRQMKGEVDDDRQNDSFR